MNNPELYKITGKLIEVESRSILREYIHIQEDGKKMVLDIGCGPGTFTRYSLFPLFQHNLDQFVGIDVSSNMVAHAKKYFTNDKITFKQLNIEDSVFPVEFKNCFNYVFSFWALHFSKDHRKVFANIFKMMRTCGEMLVVFPANSLLYDTYRLVWKKTKWASFISDADFMIMPYEHSKSPENEVRELLDDIGFKSTTCRVKKFRFVSADVSSQKDYLASIIPVFDKIPIPLQNDFLDDHIKELNSLLRLTKVEAKPYIDYNLLIAHTKKC